MEAGVTELEARLGHQVAGFVGLDAMLENVELDALVIAAPPETHEDALLGALDRGLHVLCEKPLVMPKRGATNRLELVVDAFHAAGLHLCVNTQWPCTLPYYFELYPEVAESPVESFWMQLSPFDKGIDAVEDCLPHVLSLLQALVPDPDPVLRSPEIDFLNEDASRIAVQFGYDAGAQNVPCRIELSWCPAPPRPAGYGINGRKAIRKIKLPAYELSLEGDGRSVPLRDPLEVRVAEFLSLLRGGPPEEANTLATTRLRMLESLLA
jgi:hypothetical protein